MFPSFLFFSSLFIYLFLSSFSVERSLFIYLFFSHYVESMYRSTGVCLRDTGIGRGGRERRGKEGPDDSLENSLSWE